MGLERAGRDLHRVLHARGMSVTHLMPVSPPPSATSGGFRQVLAVVDLDGPVEPVVRRAAAESSVRRIPLRVIVLHPRLPFTADPALVARTARRLGHERRRVLAAVASAARDSGLSEFDVRLVPLRRTPLMSRRGQARRTVATQLRQQPSSLLVAAEHLTPDAEADLAALEAESTADLRSFERNHV